MACLRDFAQADARRHGGDVSDPEWRTLVRLDEGLFDVTDVVYQAHGADIDLLHSCLEKTAAGVHIVVGQFAAPSRLCGARRRLVCQGQRAPGIRG